jgi:hypothetical protein
MLWQGLHRELEFAVGQPFAGPQLEGIFPRQSRKQAECWDPLPQDWVILEEGHVRVTMP